jgi:class 3 adenylate cyclase
MGPEAREVKRLYTKYLFLDVVKFSKRSAEAQTDIVSQLNEIVLSCLQGMNLDREKDVILIPTGDGVCIGLISRDVPFDAHIKLALNILERLNAHNNDTENETRRFEVRIGINQNTDILITDINGRLNVAGSGINLASRIMDQADGGQILVSETVFQELQPSERYMDKFREFMAHGKHDISFHVYQYAADDHDGLNSAVPTAFSLKAPEKAPLNELAAHYIANAILIRDEFARIRAEAHIFWENAAVLLLRFLAQDAYEISNAAKFDRAPHKMTKTGKTIAEQYKYYSDQDKWVTHDAEAHIINGPFDWADFSLFRYKECFEPAGAPYVAHFAFVNEKGIERLKAEWPDLYNSYGIQKILGDSTSKSSKAPPMPGPE